MILALALVLAWNLIGYAGFVFWFTREFDFDVAAALVGLIAAVSGPFSWLIGWSIHGPTRATSVFDTVLIRRRR